MNINDLVDSYFDRIEIEDTDFYPSDDVDLAFLSLSMPKAFLQDFLRLKGQNRDFPDVAEFWKETELNKRLKNSGKYHGQGHESLARILGYLERNVWGEYRPLENDRVGLDVFEEPDE